MCEKHEQHPVGEIDFFADALDDKDQLVTGETVQTLASKVEGVKRVKNDLKVE